MIHVAYRNAWVYSMGMTQTSTPGKYRADAVRTGHCIVSVWGSRRDVLEVELVHREWFVGTGDVEARPVVRFTGWVTHLDGTMEHIERGYGQSLDGTVIVVGDLRSSVAYGSLC